MTEKLCCFIGCAEQATIEIVGPKGSYDFDYTCDKHVEKMVKPGDMTYSLADGEELEMLEMHDGICQNEECDKLCTHSISFHETIDEFTRSMTVTYICEEHIESGRQEIKLFKGEPDGIKSHMFLTELTN